MVIAVTVYRASDGSVHETRDAAVRVEARVAVLEALAAAVESDKKFDGWFESEYDLGLGDVAEVVMAAGDDLITALQIAFGPRGVSGTWRQED